MDNYRSTHFFRILRPSIIQEKKLRIPQKFITKYGHELANAATLRVAEGSSWTMKVERIDQKVYLTDGWHEFVQHYSIGDFYFLVFEYRRKSNFEVFIFDGSCAEIGYDQLEQFPPSEGPCNVEIPKPEPMDEDEQPTKLVKITKRKRKQAIKAAEMFKTKNPSFKAIMKDYNICSAGFVNVPIQFSSKCMNAFSGPMKLRSASDGREWRVRCLNYGDKGMKIGKGWIAFKNENDLREGDVCVFELIQGTTVVLQVTLFRGN